MRKKQKHENEVDELISRVWPFEKITLSNDHTIEEQMKDITLSPNFPTTYKQEELITRCILYQNSNEKLKYETIRRCQIDESNLKVFCFYYLNNYHHEELSHLKTVCNVTENEVNEYFEGIDFETNEKAKILFGICYLHGFGYEINLEKAFGIFKEMADKGNSYGQFYVGRCYYCGDFVKKDFVESLKYMSLSAEQGNTLGIKGVGMIYTFGEGVDYEKALEMYSLAAKKGCGASMTLIGLAYQEGFGVRMDKQKAFVIYSEMASRGNINAQKLLADCYEYGKGVDIDYEMAFQFYQLSANFGNPYSQLGLALCYREGKGVQQDGFTAFEYCKLSAEQNHPTALRILGAFYIEGIYVKEDFQLGIEYYKKSAEIGDSDANIALAEHYESEGDFQSAFGYYEREASTGSKSALFEVGKFYLKGFFVEKDVNKAVDLFLMSSDCSELSVQVVQILFNEDKDLVMETIKRHRSAIIYVSECLQNDIDIVWTMMSYYTPIKSVHEVKDIKFLFR